jgi:hypothetical protein
MEDVRIDKLMYKLTVLSLKVLPMLLSLFYFIGVISSICNVEVAWVSYISGMSLIPLLFMYLVSYVFKFCAYHRMFLHYITFNMIVNCIDWYVGIPINNRMYFALFMIISCIFLFVILYLYLKSRRDEKCNNNNTRKNTKRFKS